jgi:uncharacterized protein YhaN
VRIRKLWLDGYGRFSNRELELQPGLQIIVGPNEQGKSTTRCFVGDMLYGQKRGGQLRLYAENYELRRPWNNSGAYGGRLAYELDSGRRYEVHRSFDSANEYARIYDSERGHDVTGDFEQLPNREPSFAERHLGLGREVFLSAATLSHVTLEGLGNADALAKIRDRVMALADSGNEIGSAKTAIERLQARIALIGRRDTPKRPLPAARTRLQDLQKEYEEAFAHQERLQTLEARRRDMLDEQARLRQERAAAERELQEKAQWERRQRLEEAEGLLKEVDELTQRCFELSSVRDFPLDSVPDVQRLEMRLNTARAQLARSNAQYEELQRHLAECDGDDAQPVAMTDVPEELEERLADVELRMKSARERRHEVETERLTAQQRVDSLQKTLGGFPDFSRLASDPVEWLTQLATSFAMARRAFEDERAHYQTCRERAERIMRELNPMRPLFADATELDVKLAEYSERAQRLQQVRQEAQSRAEEHRFLAQEYEAGSPGNKLLAFLAGLFMLVLIGAGAYTGNQGAYIPAVLCGVLLLWFVFHIISARRAAQRAHRRAEEAEQEAEHHQIDDAALRETVETLMERGGCQTVRELEALYETYLELMRDYEEARTACHRQEQSAREAQEHVEKLFARLVDTFDQVGETPREHGDVDDAAGRAIARYQEYRETKRRIADARDHLAHFDQHYKRLTESLEQIQREYEELSREIRQLLRANGYDEAKHDATSSAVRAYKARLSQGREQHGRRALLHQQGQQVEDQRARETQDVRALEGELLDVLERAGVDTLDLWHALAALAREYEETRVQLAALEERVHALLQGATIEALRDSVKALGPLAGGTAADAEALRAQIAALSEAIEARQKEAYDLAADLAAERAAIRPLNQIEEERAELMRQVQELELELQAASYAIALIEESARHKHALTAPQLAEAASAYLSEITGGRYGSIGITGELEISVRIPQRDVMDSQLQKRLSKGTVDQVYLALRLAMVQTLSRNGERIPMILDDPFANYDDDRLERTMQVLARVAQQNQILLFTCREDVAAAGRKLQVPVMNL